jgi:hypothetical protein
LDHEGVWTTNARSATKGAKREKREFSYAHPVLASSARFVTFVFRDLRGSSRIRGPEFVLFAALRAFVVQSSRVAAK